MAGLPNVWQLNNTDPGGKDSALLKAKKLARKMNRDEYKITFVLPGSIQWIAGRVVTMDGTWGKFAGNYIIEEATHFIGQCGYKTGITLRRCLSGY